MLSGFLEVQGMCWDFVRVVDGEAGSPLRNCQGMRVV